MTPLLKKIHSLINILRSSSKLPRECLDHYDIIPFEYKGSKYLYYQVKDDYRLLNFEDGTQTVLHKSSIIKLDSPILSASVCKLGTVNGDLKIVYQPVKNLSYYTTNINLELDKYNLIEDFTTPHFHTLDLDISKHSFLKLKFDFSNYLCLLSANGIEVHTKFYLPDVVLEDNKFYLLYPEDETKVRSAVKSIISLHEKILRDWEEKIKNSIKTFPQFKQELEKMFGEIPGIKNDTSS